MKTKLIKTETLERRFKKLQTMADFAQESCKAIVFHAGRLAHLVPTEEQQRAYQEMVSATNRWCEHFSILDSTIKATEEMYYHHLTADGKCCEVIEAIPMLRKAYMPNTFQMTDTFYQVGYYTIEGDPFKVGNKEYTVADIMKNIQELNTNVIFCLKVLARASYQGIWESTGILISRLVDFEPYEAICKLLKSYDVELQK